MSTTKPKYEGKGGGGFFESLGRFFSGLISGIGQALGITNNFHTPSNPLNAVVHAATGNVTGIIGDFFGPAVSVLNGGGDKKGPSSYTPPTSPGVGGRDVFGNTPDWINKAKG